MVVLVRDDPKLQDDSGEVPKYEQRGWRFLVVKSSLYLTENPRAHPPQGR